MKEQKCLWCGADLPKRRRKYCCDDCMDKYFEKYIHPFWWQHASRMALESAGYQCENCSSKERIEVHHIEPLKVGEHRWNSSKNRQDNLRVLCRRCHERAHHGITHRYNKEMMPKEQLTLI